jgi:signal transduction histidine kinase/ligand-binding sensor domain-containing protein
MMLRGALLALALAAPLAHALDNVARLGDYQHTVWGPQQGAPTEVITMAQSRNGWLWLGTASGLFRYDGVRFEKFAPPLAEPQLLSRGISSLWAGDNGDLWIGYLIGGVSILHEGRLRHIAAQGTDAPVGGVFGMAMDHDGSMWVATTKGLRHYVAGAWQEIGPASGFPGPRADAVFIDHDGRVWASNERRIYQLQRSTGMFVDSGLYGTADDLAETADGYLWFGQKSAWRVLAASATGRTPSARGFWSHMGRRSSMFDRDGNHWQIRCPSGVCRTAAAGVRRGPRFDVADATTEHFDQPWQMGSLAANVMLQDREGNVWIGTQAGLERFRYQKLKAAGVPGGENFFHLAADDQGQVWASTMPNAYLFRLGAGTVRQVDRSDKNIVIGTATDGSLLLVDAHRFERRRGTHHTDVALPAGPDGKAVQNNYPLLVSGDADSAWVVIASRGIYHFQDGQWVDARRYGLALARLRALVAGHEGDVWFGYVDGTIIHLGRDGQLSKLKVDTVGRVTLLDVTEGLVAGGERGLALWHNGQFHVVHAVDAEALSGISGLLIDASGDRWLNGSKGVVHVRATDWAAVLKRPELPLRYELLDALDGYPGTAQVTTIGPSAAQDRSGKLWFVGSGGVVSIDPAHIRRNSLPPPVVLTSLHTDIGEGLHALVGDYPATSGQQLPAGVSGVRINYTALSYVMPEHLRFYYKLDGVDEQWLAAGTSREAYYRQLMPGTYRFHVRASNEDGVVSQEDAVTTFSILPTFTQTLWFKLLCVGAAGALLYAVYAWRLQRLTHYYNEQMRVRLAERERIARGLHDTLLQNIQGLLLRFHGISLGLPARGGARREMQAVLDQAEQALVDSRRVITSMRVSTAHGEDLNGAFAMVGAALQDNFGARFKLTVQGKTVSLDGALGEEIYFIGREALLNAFEHAKAGEVELIISYGHPFFSLCVRDNGVGMDTASASQRQRDGHWGLSGMRERAGLIGGELSLLSEAGCGTHVVMRMAAALLYCPVPPAGWRARLAHLLRRTTKYTYV